MLSLANASRLHSACGTNLSYYILDIFCRKLLDVTLFFLKKPRQWMERQNLLTLKISPTYSKS